MMRGILTLPLLCGLLAAPAPALAEIYRCEDPSGGVRFVDDASSCPRAVKHEPRAEIQRSAGAPAAATRRSAPSPGDLESLLPDELDVGAEWEITREAPLPEIDADQRAWGVIETQARHYGRVRSGVTEVCSVELWRLASARQADAAARGIAPTGWHVEARGTLLVTLRGTRFERGKPFQKGLFPDCLAFAARVRSEPRELAR